jgi:hypothetical protein
LFSGRTDSAYLRVPARELRNGGAIHLSIGLNLDFGHARVAGTISDEANGNHVHL